MMCLLYQCCSFWFLLFYCDPAIPFDVSDHDYPLSSNDHCLNLFVNWTLGNKMQSIFYWKFICFHSTKCIWKKIVCQMSAILLRHQRVNGRNSGGVLIVTGWTSSILNLTHVIVNEDRRKNNTDYVAIFPLLILAWIYQNRQLERSMGDGNLCAEYIPRIMHTFRRG